MNKAELVAAIAAKSELSKKDAEKALKAFTEVVTEATCIEGGYTTYTCQTCGYTYQDNLVEATGHNHQVSVVAPTCVSYGFTVHLCADCGDRYVIDYVKPLGHTFEDTVVEATEDNIGYTKHQCTVCDYSYLSDYVTSGDKGYTQLPEEPEQPTEPVEPIEPETPDTPEVPDEPTEPETPEEPSEPENPDSGNESENPDDTGDEEETHEYVFSPLFDSETKILTVTYDCECGESYSGTIQLFITDSAENTTVEVINGNTSIDFTERQDDYSIIAIDENGNVIGVFEVDNQSVGTGESADPDEQPNDSEQSSDSETSEEENKDKKGNNTLLSALLAMTAFLLAVGSVVTYILIKKNKNKNEKEKGDK